MTGLKHLVVVISAVASCSVVALAESPVQLALWPPDLQLVGEDNSIKGLRLNIYGRNYDVTGLDLGLVHESQGSFKGLALGLISMADEDVRGLQWTWLYARAGASASAWQAGLLSDRKSTRLNSSHMSESRMPSSA